MLQETDVPECRAHEMVAQARAAGYQLYFSTPYSLGGPTSTVWGRRCGILAKGTTTPAVDPTIDGDEATDYLVASGR